MWFTHQLLVFICLFDRSTDLFDRIQTFISFKGISLCSHQNYLLDYILITLSSFPDSTRLGVSLEHLHSDASQVAFTIPSSVDGGETSFAQTSLKVLLTQHQPQKLEVFDCFNVSTCFTTFLKSMCVVGFLRLAANWQRNVTKSDSEKRFTYCISASYSISAIFGLKTHHWSFTNETWYDLTNSPQAS